MPQLTAEQLKAVRTLDRNVAVSAGAGSGKTRVLTERFVHILETGLAHPENMTRTQEILAVTFTEKAAAEMRERIRETLQERLRGAGQDREALQFWRNRIQELPRTQIGTLHSLCSSLLRMNPLESHVDPAFQILLDPDLDRFLQEETRTFVLQEARRGTLSILLDEYGASVLEETLKEQFADGEYPTEADWQDALRRAENPREIPGAGKSKKQEEPEYESPDDAARNTAKEKQLLAAWQELLPRFAAHMKAAKERLNVLTFNDLEQRAVDMLKHSPELCARYRNRFRYIMVDEFQDTNNRQKELVYLLSGGDAETLKGRNLFVVGDAKQSIYRFRGADVSVFQKVQEEIRQSGGVTLSLSLNFRSRAPVIAFCNDFFRRTWGDTSPDTRNVWSETQEIPAFRREEDKEAPLPELYFREGKTDSPWEARTVSRRLRELHEEEDVPYADMAILMRTMGSIQIMLQALKEEGVPVKVVDGRDFYNRQDMRDLLNLFAFVADPHQDGPLLGLLRSPYFRVPDSFLLRLCAQRALDYEQAKKEAENKEGVTLPDLWSLLLWDETLPVPVRDLVHRLDELHRQGVAMNLSQFVPYMERILHPEARLAGQENGTEKLANYRKFRNLVLTFAEEQDGTVSAFAERLAFLQANYSKEAAATAAADDTVTVMTIHKSKGLEFPVVALPFTGQKGGGSQGTPCLAYRPGKGVGLSYEGASGDGSNPVKSTLLTELLEDGKTAEEQEARRLLYVALTRAEQRLLVTGLYHITKAGKRSFGMETARALYDYGSLQDLLAKAKRDAGEERDVPGNRAAFRPLVYFVGAEKEEAAQAAAAARNMAADAPASKAARSGKRTPSSPRLSAEALAPLPGYEATGLAEFTPSMLQDYEFCQRRFYYKNVEHIVPFFDEEQEDIVDGGAVREGSGGNLSSLPAGVLPAGVLSPTAVGHVIHRTLERVGLRFVETGTLAGEEEWRRAYENALYEFVAGATLAERKEKAGACGIPAMLEGYRASSLYREFARKQTRAEFDFRLPFPSGQQPLFHVTGTIDAIGRDGDGNWEIVDYKTGQLPRGDEEGALKPGYAYQLALYWYAVEQLVQDLSGGTEGQPPRTVARAVLHYLRGPRCVGLASAEEKDRWLARVQALCLEIRGKGGEADFAPTTREGACGRCPYHYMCRR